MWRIPVTILFLCSGPGCMDAQMNVALCDGGQVHASLLRSARAETEFVFGSAGIRIIWTACGSFESLAAASPAPVFVVRLRTDTPRQPVGSSSLDTMGRAFLARNKGGSLADAYLPAIEGNAKLYDIESGELLGCVIAHELGHLLLGSGHSADGLMRSGWRGTEARNVVRRWLKFNTSQAARMQSELRHATAISQMGE